MAEWKPFDLKWGRSIWYCSACEESTEVPTYLGTPMYNFCPMCGANMNMKSENKQADTPQTDCDTCKHYKLACELFSEICKYEPTTQTETQNSNLTFDTPQTESTGSPIGDYRDGVGAWQTERMTEEEIDTMIAKGLLGQTDCGWK